jgi:hypothetical protein
MKHEIQSPTQENESLYLLEDSPFRAKQRTKYFRVAALIGVVLVSILMNACRPEGQDMSKTVDAQSKEDARRERVALDPRQCPGGGDGNIYIALGETVFRIPATYGLVMISPVQEADETELRKSSRPEVLPGCYEHPASAQGLHLTSYQTQIFSRKDFNGDPQPLRWLSVGWLHKNHRVFLQESNIHTSDSMLKRGLCREVADGLLGCVAKDVSGSETSSYRTQTTSYSTVDGWPWVVVCGFGPSILADDCQTHYRLRDGLAVSYRFDKTRVPPARMISLDLAVRRGIESIIVNDYSWPPSAPSRTPSNPP